MEKETFDQAIKLNKSLEIWMKKKEALSKCREWFSISCKWENWAEVQYNFAIDWYSCQPEESILLKKVYTLMLSEIDNQIQSIEGQIKSLP